MGCEVVFSGTPDYDITKQIASFEQDLVKSPKGILLHPMQADPFIEPINRAIDSGVSIVTFAADSPNSKRTSYITSDNLAEAKFAAEEIAEAARRQGRVCGAGESRARATTTCASPPSSPTWRRTIPEMKLVGRQASNQDSNKAYQAVQAMLQANPNLGALWIPEAGSAEGAVAAVLEAKADVVIMHADVTPTTLEHIKAGNIHMALNPNQGMQGYMGFLATFMAAHPDLIDPFNDYKRSGYNPMRHPVHRQRLRGHHQGKRRRLRPRTSTWKAAAEPRPQPRPPPAAGGGRPPTVAHGRSRCEGADHVRRRSS